MRCSHPCSSVWAPGKVPVLQVTEQLPPLGLLVVTFQIQPQSTRDTRQPQPFSPARRNTLSKAAPCLTLTSSGAKEQRSRAYNSLLQKVNPLFKDQKAASRNVLLTLPCRTQEMWRDQKAPPAKDMHSQVSITCHRISTTGGSMLDQDQCDRSLYPYLKKELANKSLLSLPGRQARIWAVVLWHGHSRKQARWLLFQQKHQAKFNGSQTDYNKGCREKHFISKQITKSREYKSKIKLKK